MTQGLTQWIRKHYNQVVGSIAFWPALIALGFLLIAILMLQLDFSETGKSIKSRFGWISLKDASTARTILAAIAGGLISLTVFSFSMVMILLNQAASQLSNRMLDSMIGNRFQQMVLGFYLGSIVYSLFLLSTIRDIDSGIYVPALSVYLLLLLTVVDIFLFIYFLHYVTQSVKYQTIIERIHKKTIRNLEHTCEGKRPQAFQLPDLPCTVVRMPKSDYFQGFQPEALKTLACRKNGTIAFLHPTATYLLQGTPLLRFYGNVPLDGEDLKDLFLIIDLYTGHAVERNAYYGFHQLAEVALKALSPGINDPETAVLSLHSLTDLFRRQLSLYFPADMADEEGILRVRTIPWNFEKLFHVCFIPIWNYGKKDMYIREAMVQMLEQLLEADAEGRQTDLLSRFLARVKEEPGN